MQQERRLESNGDPNSFIVRYGRVVVGREMLGIKRENGLITESAFQRRYLELEAESKRLLVSVAQKAAKLPFSNIASVSEMVIECGQSGEPIPYDLEREFLRVTGLSISATILN